MSNWAMTTANLAMPADPFACTRIRICCRWRRGARHGRAMLLEVISGGTPSPNQGQTSLESTASIEIQSMLQRTTKVWLAAGLRAKLVNPKKWEGMPFSPGRRTP